MKHLTGAIWALFSIAVHACIGLGFYALYVNEAVDPGSALFWAWMGAWPLMLLITWWPAIWWILAIIAVAGVVFSLWRRS